MAKDKKIGLQKKELEKVKKSMKQILEEIEDLRVESTKSPFNSVYQSPWEKSEGKAANGCDKYWSQWCANINYLYLLFRSTYTYLEKIEGDLTRADEAEPSASSYITGALPGIVSGLKGE